LDRLRETLVALRETLEGKIDGNQKVNDTRMDAADDAVKLLQRAREAMPAETEARIQHLKDWVIERFSTVTERFEGVNKGFELRDKASETSTTEAKTNIKDALAAQEKLGLQATQSANDAVSKTELQTTKQVDGLNGRITELGERETRLEGQVTALIAAVAVAQQNQQVVKTDQRASGTFTLSLVMGAVGIAGFVMALIEILRHP